jgi:polysaccharide deacetylase family protein (PEP-CTERM system associated)
VNLEDYFHVDAFNRFVQQNRWQRFESRLDVSTTKTLELLSLHRATATFFVLGWIAEQFPGLVRQIADAGHEIAVRGYYHRSVKEMTHEEFRSDTLRARDAVERAGGQRVRGYRVADGWFGPDDLWALDILAELGFTYDSSIAPIGSTFADDPRRRTPHLHQSKSHRILEIPISTGSILGFRMPVAGGNYLRQLPRFLTRRAAAKWVKRFPSPLVAYFQSWELDPDQPRLTAGGRMTRLRHYRNLDRMPARLGELLSTYTFTSCREYLKLETVPCPRGVDDQSQTPAPLRQQATPAGGHVAFHPNRPAITVVVPCYNEELLVPHLKNTLDEVRTSLADQYDATFLLVDDGSKDKTWEKMQAAFGKRPGYQLARHDVNQGIAAAVMTGIKLSHTEIVCSMDSDCSYDPLKLAEMIPLLTPGVDLVTASPYHPAGAVRNVPAWRLTLSKGCAWAYRRVMKTKLYTFTSCFRVYRRSTVAALQLRHNRYLGIAELVGRLDLAGKAIVEFPAILECRTFGRSKMKTFRTVLGHIGLMARLRWDRFRQAKDPDRDSVIRSQVSLVSHLAAGNTETLSNVRRTPPPVRTHR